MNLMTNTINSILNKTVDSLFGNHTSFEELPSNESIGQYAMLKSYEVIYERNKIKRPIQTQIPIQHSDNIWFGASPKQVQEQMSTQPQMAMFNTEGLNRKIFHFREKVDVHIVNIEMHFHNNELFLFKTTFKDASPEIRISLMKSLLSEFQLPSIDLSLHSVFDSNNNCIQIRDLASFEVIYTAMDSPFFDKLVKIITKSNNQLLADYHLTSAPLKPTITEK